MHEADAAISLFARGFNCSQSVLLAFAPRFGMEGGVAARLASPFGGGLARQGHVCGAITGAVMVLGLHAGNAAADDAASKEAAYAKVRALMARFTAAHGSTECRQLTGHDLGTPEGYAAATEARVFTERCPAYVRAAAELVREVLTTATA